MRTTITLSMRAGIMAAMLTVVAGTAAGQYRRGVNVSQAEWGDPLNPYSGVGNYTYATAPTFQYFAARALPFIRLLVKWERLQPTLGGALDQTQLGYLQQDVAYAAAAGAVVSIVPHNEARYATLESQVADYDNPVGGACIIDNPCPGSPVNVTTTDFVNFWVQMSTAFKNEPAVVAYDLTNEPHDMGQANWANIAQAAVTAIRGNDDHKTIMIEGDGWANATYWAQYNGSSAFISDPDNNYYYEAHLYFDHDFSGTYAWPYDQEAQNTENPAFGPNVGADRLAPFVTWCETNNVPCYLGEYGIPNDDPRWLTVLNNFLNELDSASMSGTYWAAGELWVDYPLSAQPSNNFTTDAEQMGTLLAHLAPDSFLTVSAAALYGWASAPGELAAGYGKSLAPGTVAASGSFPTTLENTQVSLTDSKGNVSFAPLLFVSPGQINYQIPSSVAAGVVTARVLNGSTIVASGLLEVESVAPTIFTANENGQGVAAAQIQRVHPDGSQSFENVFTYDQATKQNVAVPIAFDGDRLFLVLYGTGFDQASGAGGTVVTVGGTATTVTYSGWPKQYAGEDQIDAELPSSLAGAGQVTVMVTVDGNTANPVTVTFQ